MKKKYLVYLDILGFEEKAKDIAKKSGFDVGVIRENFLSNPLKNKIKGIKRKEIEIFQGISEIEGSDNYILIIDGMETVLEVVGELTMIKIPHKEFGCIPLEVAADVREIDEKFKVEPKNRNEVIRFLKNDIVNPYRKYYKNKHGDSTKETFVLFTREFFDELEPLDKKHCEEISYGGKTFLAADLEKTQQRCKIFDFLRKIGYPNSKIYGRIDELYVPPVEYEDIKETLKKENIVFITGTQEYGKTYTAVRLMWEYFKKGYEPRWMKGGEEKERITVRQRLEEIRVELKPNRIIYFEDPFGKTTYEKREGLEKEIGTIINCVRGADNVYVIITSREEVFKEFEKEKLTKKSIKEYEKSLNLKTPSYGVEKRKEILLKWAESEGCTWIENKWLRGPVLESMENEKVLSTPLRIRDFTIDTVNVDRKDELEEKIREKSEEVAMAFSREIRSMSDDKILFLSFLFISNYFRVDFIRRMYEEMMRNLQLKEAWEFDKVLDWFKDDKVNVSIFVGFSHPAYFEALENLLVEKGYVTRINKEIFSRLLIRLSEKDKAAWHVARAVMKNFNNLPEEVRNLLFTLAEKDKAARAVARAMRRNFDKLPGNVRSRLLFTLAEKDKAAGRVAHIVAENFDYLPDDVRSRLLFTLAEKDETAGDVSKIVMKNFNNLSENVRNKLLLSLAEKDEAAGDVSKIVMKNFNNLSENVRNKLLLSLAEKDVAAGDVAWAVAENFNNLPENVRNKLLLSLAEKDEAAWYVAWAVAENFNNLPENVRNKLLLSLAEKDEAASNVSKIVMKNFNNLPENVRNLLFTIAEKDEVAGYLSKIVMKNFNNLPKNVRNKLLLSLAEKDEAAGDVAWAVAENFNNLPKNVRNKLLLSLAEKDKAAWYVAWIVMRNPHNLPGDVRNKLLLSLAEKGITL